MDWVEAKLSNTIIGCGIRVHRTLGPGFLEKVYEAALLVELAKAGLSCEQQKNIPLVYAGQRIGEHRVDVLVEGRVVLELKACKDFEDIHLTTARSYLKATGAELALLLNFAKTRLAIRRVVLSS
jgi:GxxExxY protein